MGTRADFYVGRGVDAEWIGSIGWDGYPPGIDAQVLNCTSEAAFRSAVSDFFKGRRDVTLPQRGWPWPWNNSSTTDFAYAIDGEEVFASCFGGVWLNAAKYDELAKALEDSEEDDSIYQKAEFPNMAERKNVRMDEGSGLIVVGI